LGFFNKAAAYTTELIFTQNTSKDVVPGKEVAFGGHKVTGTKFTYLDNLKFKFYENCSQHA